MKKPRGQEIKHCPAVRDHLFQLFYRRDFRTYFCSVGRFSEDSFDFIFLLTKKWPHSRSCKDKEHHE